MINKPDCADALATSVQASWRRKVDSFFGEISIADIQTKVVKLVALTPGLFIILITPNLNNPIYMDPDYNSPLIY